MPGRRPQASCFDVHLVHAEPLPCLFSLFSDRPDARRPLLLVQFTSGGTSLWMRNVQLGLFAIPLQALAIGQWDMGSVRDNGLLQGFRLSNGKRIRGSAPTVV